MLCLIREKSLHFLVGKELIWIELEKSESLLSCYKFTLDSEFLIGYTFSSSQILFLYHLSSSFFLEVPSDFLKAALLSNRLKDLPRLRCSNFLKRVLLV